MQHLIHTPFDGCATSAQNTASALGVSISGVSGFGNQISDNTFSDNLFAGAEIIQCSNIKVCANDGFTQRSFYFLADNMGLDFSQNHFRISGFDIQGKIFSQVQKDNTFEDIGPFQSYARCIDNNCKFDSRFEVRQNTGSEYYPTLQFCGMTLLDECSGSDEFFVNTPGSPSGACVTEFSDPSDELFTNIATDSIGDVNEYAAKRWHYESFLYNRLRQDTALLNSNIVFADFIQEKQGTPVEKFYNFEKSIVNAFSCAGENCDSINKLFSQIDSLAEAIFVVDSLLDIEITTQLVELKQEKTSNYQELWLLLEEQMLERRDSVQLRIQNALNLNNDISATSVYENNEKTVNKILLSQHVFQNGFLSEGQKDTLTDIANQCFKTGGIAVFRAPAALRNCYAVMPDFWENCGEERFLPFEFPEEEERPSATSNGNTPPLRVVVANGIIEITGENLNNFMVSISDLMGRSIFQHTVDSNTDSGIQLKLPHELPAGLVFITIWSSGQTYSTKVFVRNQ